MHVTLNFVLGSQDFLEELKTLLTFSLVSVAISTVAVLQHSHVAGWGLRLKVELRWTFLETGALHMTLSLKTPTALK